jgi:hypothetical protein
MRKHGLARRLGLQHVAVKDGQPFAVLDFPAFQERRTTFEIAMDSAVLDPEPSGEVVLDQEPAAMESGEEDRHRPVARVCIDIGIKPSPLSFYCIEAKLKPAFVFGFAAWTPAQIRESLLRLAPALR